MLSIYVYTVLRIIFPSSHSIQTRFSIYLQFLSTVEGFHAWKYGPAAQLLLNS